MRVQVLSLTAAAALSALAAPAQAQEKLPLGVQAVVSEIYDSNVARSSYLLASARGVSESDWITEPGVTLNLNKTFGQQSAFLRGSVGYDFYARNTRLNSEHLDLAAGLNARLSRCKGQAVFDYQRQQSDLQQLSLAVTRNIQDSKTITLEGDCGAEIGFAPKVMFSEQWVDNGSSLLTTSNYRHMTVTPGVAYRRPNFGELWVYGVYDETVYPARSGLGGLLGADPGYKDYGGGVRYDRKIGARLEAAVKVGYNSLRPTDSRLANFEGVTWGFEGTMRVSGRLQAQLSFQRTPLPADRPNVTYLLQNSVSGQIDYAISPRLHLTAGASNSDNRYQGAALLAGLDVAHEDVTAGFGALRYSLGRRFTVELNGRHETRRANVTAYSYDDDRIGITFSGHLN